MSETSEVAVSEVPVEASTDAPATVETASTEAAPVSGEETPETEKPSKTFTQEELDEQIGKRLARERRKWEREQAKQQPVQAPQPVQADAEPKKPDISTFKTVEEYDAAMEQYADQKLAFKEAKKQKEQQEASLRRAHEEILHTHDERQDAARDKYADYDEVIGNPELPITSFMADVILVSETGPEIAYFLGKNPKEAARISKLAPIAQVKEIGKLEAKLLADPPKKPSSAPAPIKPVTARSGTNVIDTLDPKSLEKLGTSKWIEAERQRQARAWEQKHR